jgi:hypothetical protein
LKSIEEENCNLRTKINMNSRFDVNCKCTTTEHLNSMKRAETNSEFEQEKLSAKFNTVCEKLYETKIAFSDVRNTINCDIFNIENKVDIMQKLLEVENSKKRLLIQNQQLKDKNSLTNEELIVKNKKIKKLQRENDYYNCKINKQNKHS